MNRFITAGKRHLPVTIAGTALILALGWFIYFVLTDNTPQKWDESIHLNTVLDYTRLLQNDPLSVIRKFFTENAYFPPLVHIVIAVLLVPFRFSTDAALLASWIWIAGLLSAGYYIFKRNEFSQTTAFTGSTLIVLLPFMQLASRNFMLDIPLTLMVLLTLGMISSRADFSYKHTGIIAFSFIVAMLIKWTAFIYLTPGLIIYFFRVGKVSDRKKLFVHLFLFFVLTAIVLSTWYFPKIIVLPSRLLRASYITARGEGDPYGFTLENTFYYITHLWKTMGWPLCIVTIIALFRYGKLVIKRYPVIFWTVFISWLFFTFGIDNKDDRYIMPIIPLLIFPAALLVKHSGRRWLFPVLILFYSFSLGINSFKEDVPFTVYKECVPKVRTYEYREILNTLESLDIFKVSVINDLKEINNVHLAYKANLYNSPVAIAGIWNFPFGCNAFLIADRLDWQQRWATRIKLEKAIHRGDWNTVFKKHSTYTIGNQRVSLYRRALPAAKQKQSVQIRRALNKVLHKYLAHYVKEPDAVEVTWSAPHLAQGKIDVLHLSGTNLRIGDFKHKPDYMSVNKLTLQLEDIMIDWHYLLQEQKLRLLDLGSISINQVSIDQSAINAFLRTSVAEVPLSVLIASNALTISAPFCQIQAAIKAVPDAHMDKNLYLDIKGARLFGIPVPTWILQTVLDPMINPLLSNVGVPFDIQFDYIEMKDNRLLIAKE